MTSSRKTRALGAGLATAVLGLLPTACGRPAGASTSAAPPSVHARTPGLSLAADLGKLLFFDKTLSASGAMSCATCHDPDHAYGPPNDLPAQLGGPEGRAQGGRAVPSLRYKEYTPPYADLLDNPDGISVPGPGGGFAWDGRADTLAAQARLPLLSPVEMANASPADVVRKLEAAPYAPLLREAFPNVAATDAPATFEAVLGALEAFQREDSTFHPYTSKFDLRNDNKLGGTFTAAEMRGYKLFVDARRGNCASCHYHGAGLHGSVGMFTDYSYEAIGVPRNRALAANADPASFDLGVCGPLRGDHAPAPGGKPSPFCGMFKTPTLRNVAARKVFFHNGVVHSLEQAVRFYATRDTMPELWYPTVGGQPKARNDRGFPSYGLVTRQYVGGTVEKYDDLPVAYRANVDPQMPLDGRPRAAKPPLDDRDVADLICFLETLTDGYRRPTVEPTSGRCVN